MNSSHLGRQCRTSVPVHATRSVRSSARRAVVVEANLFARIARLTKSTVNNLVTTAEDPEKLLDQVVNEMQDDLIKMRQAAAQVLASQKQLEAKYKTAQGTAKQLESKYKTAQGTAVGGQGKRAELAVAKSEDELAKEALKRRKAFQDDATNLNMQLDMQKQAVSNLMDNTKVMSMEAESESIKMLVMSMEAEAESIKMLVMSMEAESESVKMLVMSMEAESESIKMLVMSMEAEAESIKMLVLSMEAESESIKMLVMSMEAESESVKIFGHELAALKKGAMGASKPPALPAGAASKDAFDLELEEMRKKAITLQSGSSPGPSTLRRLGGYCAFAHVRTVDLSLQPMLCPIPKSTKPFTFD
eukprot:gene29656-5075_t